MKSKLVYPGGWIRTNYANSVFGDDALKPCEVCGRRTCATVWLHLETRVVRCAAHEPKSVVDWSDDGMNHRPAWDDLSTRTTTPTTHRTPLTF